MLPSLRPRETKPWTATHSTSRPPSWAATRATGASDSASERRCQMASPRHSRTTTTTSVLRPLVPARGSVTMAFSTLPTDSGITAWDDPNTCSEVFGRALQRGRTMGLRRGNELLSSDRCRHRRNCPPGETAASLRTGRTRHPALGRSDLRDERVEPAHRERSRRCRRGPRPRRDLRHVQPKPRLLRSTSPARLCRFPLLPPRAT